MEIGCGQMAMAPCLRIGVLGEGDWRKTSLMIGLVMFNAYMERDGREKDKTEVGNG